MKQDPESAGPIGLEEYPVKSPDSSVSQMPTFASSEPADAMPIPAVIRNYKIHSLLGSGGMGRVFKAFDPTLNRYVALKFLRTEEGGFADRFIQEARAQARVEHEHVCKIYEAGEVEGRRFIAMQLIDGMPLSAAARNMNLEHKLRLVRQVAEALHAAHRKGLIHRDIKPSNIMVEKTEDGAWKPYVMDFGLAKEQQAPGVTMSGAIVGTPRYMPPEQAQGLTEQLDRRSDVYSLGATLYEMLGGRPPFQGRSASDVLIQVLQVEPAPLRKLDAAIPLDVETIVAKCLQKEPGRRYDSARALAEDLTRYLDGEPILARPVSVTERWIKKAKRNKVATAILFAGVLLTALLTAAMLYLQLRARAQEKYAREFGDEVSGIQAMLNSVYSAPAHDVTGEISIAKNRLADLQSRMKTAGEWASAPGHYALGLGYYSLFEYEEALENLQIAWNARYHEPNTAYVMGQLYGILYQRALTEAEGIQSKELRDEKKKEIEGKWKIPAISYLKLAKGSTESTAYVEGLIALYEKRYDDALRNAGEAHRQANWSLDAEKLEGDAYMALGKNAEDEGNFQTALKYYDQAGIFYARAIDLGRSRYDLYISEADRRIAQLRVYQQLGQGYNEALKRAMEPCDRAIMINPGRSDAYTTKASAYLESGVVLLYTSSEDPKGLMRNAIAMAHEASRRNPGDASAFGYACEAYRVIGESEARGGQDPRRTLRDADAACAQALKIDPRNLPAVNSRGVLYSLLGEYELRTGKDPRPTFRKAIDQYDAAVKIFANQMGPHTHAAIAYWYMGGYETDHGIDSRAAFEKAISQIREALKINSNNFVTYSDLLLVYQEYGRFQIINGADPLPLLEKAIQAGEKALALNPSNVFLMSGFLLVYDQMAQYLLMKGQDPTAVLAKAKDAFNKCLSINPKYYEPYRNQGVGEVIAARWAAISGRNPEEHFQAAHRAFEKSLELNEQDDWTYGTLAELYRREAGWRQAKRRPAEDLIRAGLEAARKSLAADPFSAETFACQGALELLAAKEANEAGVRRQHVHLARDSFQKAFQLNPRLRPQYLGEVNELAANSAN